MTNFSFGYKYSSLIPYPSIYISFIVKASMGMGWLFPLCFHFQLFHFSFSHSFCHPHDNLALLHFEASLTINNTMYSSYDDDDGDCHQVYPTIQTWENGTYCCSWYGVRCDPISGHVTAIDLACAGLQGQINANSTPFHSFSYAITQSCFQ